MTPTPTMTSINENARLNTVLRTSTSEGKLFPVSRDTLAAREIHLMAFDMYYGKHQDLIDHHEEDLFMRFVAEDRECPTLQRLWENFYDGPTLSAETCNLLVHELIALKPSIQKAGRRDLLHTVDRLLPFFSRAYRAGASVNCVSD